MKGVTSEAKEFNHLPGEKGPMKAGQGGLDT